MPDVEPGEARRRTALLVDGDNIDLAASAQHVKVEYTHLDQMMVELGCDLVDKRYYVTRGPRSGGPARQARLMTNLGYAVVEVEQRAIDVHMAIDAVDVLSAVDELVLASGDGGFAGVLDRARLLGKATTVVGFKEMMSSRLVERADRVVFLDGAPFVSPVKSGLVSPEKPGPSRRRRRRAGGGSNDGSLRPFPILPSRPAPLAPSPVTSTAPRDSQPPPLLQVFLCHSSGDKPAVRDIYRRLTADGFRPWLDEEDILPGQDWDREIQAAVRASHLVLACVSHGSINKAGYLQKEIGFALDVALEQPEETIFIIPARLEECPLPARLARWQRVDLFLDRGYERLLRALEKRRHELFGSAT